MENVVLAVFKVESEAYQALSEIRNAPLGQGYAVAEAALIKNDEGKIGILDAFNYSGAQSDDTSAGIIIGSLVGILGGPLGVLLGASAGGMIGSMVATDDAVTNLSGLEIIAGKTYEGEVAIAALVQEDEPAFDAALDKFDTTIARYDAADVMADIDRANEKAEEALRQAHLDLKAERKAERDERREEVRANLKAKFAKISGDAE